MKKTLMTLALAATVASGSAMAWTASGAGGHIELSGKFKPAVKKTPWEVMAGSGSANLIGEVQNGQKVTEIEITKAIPILGIRTKSTDLFTGGAGFNPQIDFNGDVGTDKVSKGVGELTLAVTGMDGNKIGTLKAPFTMIGVGYRKPRDGAGSVSALASYSSGKGFFGGLPKSMQHTYPIDKIEATANMLIPGVSSNFSHSGAEITGYASMDFTASEYDYSAYYVSGITSDSKIQFELNALLPSGEVEWKASLPIVVTYS